MHQQPQRLTLEFFRSFIFDLFLEPSIFTIIDNFINIINVK